MQKLEKSIALDIYGMVLLFNAGIPQDFVFDVTLFVLYSNDILFATPP